MRKLERLPADVNTKTQLTAAAEHHEGSRKQSPTTQRDCRVSSLIGTFNLMLLFRRTFHVILTSVNTE